MKQNKRQIRAARKAKAVRLARWNGVPMTRSRFVGKEFRSW
jgi:hypothetical protein